MIRTDIHRPSAIDPAEYEYIGSVDSQEPFYSDLMKDQIEDLYKRAHNSKSAPYSENVSKCDHCGAYLRYVCFWFHTPTGDVITTGEICAQETMDVPDRTTLELKRLREDAASRRQRQKEEERRIGNLEYISKKFPEAYNLLVSYQGENTFILNVASRMDELGFLTEKQANAVIRAAQKDKEFKAHKEEEEKNASPVVEGKGIKITGRILNMYSKDTDFGTRYVMTVLDDRGFKVWGSEPSTEEEINPNDRIEFIANTTKSDRDETFGFFKRPRKLVKL